MNAPVAVFAFNRPDHLRRTLQTLMDCTGADRSPITVFCDGPRSDAEKDAVAATRQTARDLLGNATDIREAATNQGLARSIIGGVSELVERDGRAIVIEDDLDLAPCFIEYMNAALNRYADTESVFQISGHMFDVPAFSDRTEAIFLPFTTTWGWATWDRAWTHFDPEARGWERLNSDRALRSRFNLNGTYDYTALMKMQMAGKSNSWGIRWYWSVFEQNGLVLFPPKSLVQNNGQDGSGTHGGGVLSDFSGADGDLLQIVPSLPDKIAVDPDDFAAAVHAIWRQNGGWPGWALNKAKALVGR